MQTVSGRIESCIKGPCLLLEPNRKPRVIRYLVNQTTPAEFVKKEHRNLGEGGSDSVQNACKIVPSKATLVGPLSDFGKGRQRQDRHYRLLEFIIISTDHHWQKDGKNLFSAIWALFSSVVPQV